MKLKRLLCSNSFLYNVFFVIMSLNLLISGNARGLSQKNLFTNDRDVSYSRGIYLIIASNEQILTYLVNENLGGNTGSIVYDLTAELDTNEYPGFYNSAQSIGGRVIPEKQFPIFDIEIGVNDLFEGETVTSGEAEGFVESWNNKATKIIVKSYVME